MKNRLIFLIVTACCFTLTACNSAIQPTIKKVNPVLHKTLAAQKEPEKTESLQIGQKEYHFQYNAEPTKYNILATMTAQGIVWAPDIEMLDTSSVLDKVPKEPYKLYLNKNEDSTISVQNSEYLTSLPLKDNKKNYIFLNQIYGINNYVIYDTDMKKKGMNKPAVSKLYILDLVSKKVKLITNYHDSGGNFFDFGINKETNDIVYIQTSPDKDDYKKEAHIYHIKTGKNEKLENFKLEDSGISYSSEGKKHSINNLDLH